MQRSSKLDRNRGAGRLARGAHGALVLGALVLAILFPACRAVQSVEGVVPGGKKKEKPLAITDDVLRGGLRDLFASFTLTVQDASHQIEVAEQDVSLRRSAVAWKIAAVGDMAATQLQTQALAGFVDGWSFTAQMEAFFAEDGAGADYFGPSTHYARDASVGLHQSYGEFGKSFMTSEQYAAASDEITRFASDHPITGAFARSTNRPSSESPKSGYEFGQILSLPLAPFKAFDGIDAGAAAIHEVATMGTQFTAVVGSLPQLVHWNIQLAMYDMQRLEEVQSAIASLDRFSHSTESMAATAEALPDDLQQLVTKTLEDVNAQQGELQKTLEDAKAVVVEVRATTDELGPRLEQVTALSASLDQTAQAVTETGVAWEKTIAAINLLAGNTDPPAGSDSSGARTESAPSPESSEPAAPPHPFDIREYEATANALTKTAEELRAVLADMSGLVESPAFAARLDDVEQQAQGVVTASGDELRETLDHAGLRLAQLAGLVFVLVLAYKGIGGRLARS